MANKIKRTAAAPCNDRQLTSFKRLIPPNVELVFAIECGLLNGTNIVRDCLIANEVHTLITCNYLTLRQAAMQVANTYSLSTKSIQNIYSSNKHLIRFIALNRGK